MTLKANDRERIDFSKIKTFTVHPEPDRDPEEVVREVPPDEPAPAEREDVGLQSVFKSVSSRSATSGRTRRSSSSSTRSGTGSASAAGSRDSSTCARPAHVLRRGCSRRIRTARARCSARRAATQNEARGDVCDICGTTVDLQAEVRRRGVPGARHDLRRAAQGHDPPRRVEQGPGDGRQDHPRHQGAGGLLRRHPADDRARHVHHQRHRARDRLAAPPLAGRVLPRRGQALYASRRSSRTAARGWSSSTTRRTCSTSGSTASASSWRRCSCARSACAAPTSDPAAVLHPGEGAPRAAAARSSASRSDSARRRRN